MDKFFEIVFFSINFATLSAWDEENIQWGAVIEGGVGDDFEAVVAGDGVEGFGDEDGFEAIGLDFVY